MSRTARIARNIITNWLGFVVSAALTLLLTPYVLEQLGPARYGIWVLTSSIVGYYGILDLGFRAGLTQHLTRYLAMGKFDVASEYLSSAVVAMCGFAAFVAFLAIAGAYFAPSMFDIPTDLEHEAFLCILIIGLGASMQFALFPFAAIFPAAERFDIANYIGISTSLLSAGLMLLVLKLGYGLVGASAAILIANIVDYSLRWLIASFIVPKLRFSRHRIVFSRLRDIMSFGIWNFLISINMYAYQHAPTIIIASFLRLPAIGQYALATGLMQQLSSALSPIGQVMYPSAAAMHAQNDLTTLKRLYHDGTRLMMLIMVSAVLIAGFFAEDFYRLWIGEQYLSGEPYTSVAVLLQVLLVSTFTSFTANIGIQILKGTGRIQLIAIALICGSVLSIFFSILLIRHYGLMGIAISVVIASAIIDLIVAPVLVQRVLGFSAVEWMRMACSRPLMVALVDAVLLYFIQRYLPVNSWWDLIFVGAVSGLVCTLVAFIIGVTSEERVRFVFKPLRTVSYFLRKSN